MAEVLEYYLTGGQFSIGKKEFVLELMREDSVLRVLLGAQNGNLEALKNPVDIVDKQEYNAFDFTGRPRVHIGEDPTPLLCELKNRYGGAISGMLYFDCLYTTFEQTSHLCANLDTDKIVLELRTK